MSKSRCRHGIERDEAEPIDIEALRQRVAELEDVLQELMTIVDGLVEDGLGGDQIDSLTTQPARLLLKKLSGL